MARGVVCLPATYEAQTEPVGYSVSNRLLPFLCAVYSACQFFFFSLMQSQSNTDSGEGIGSKVLVGYLLDISFSSTASESLIRSCRSLSLSLPMGNSACFSSGKASCNRVALPKPPVHAGCFSVSIIHRTPT